MMRDLAEVFRAVFWPAAAVYAIWRWAAVAELVVERMRPVLPSASPDDNVPSDLVALAMTHSEAWAQEDTLKAMRERYAELKDWQKVRFAFGVGRVDG